LEGGIVVVIQLSERLKNWFAGLNDYRSFRPEVGLGYAEEVGLGDFEEVGHVIEMTTAGPETENAFDLN
jgi:hypothetical protein